MPFWSKKGFDVLVNVTDVCDARCVMCNIWKNQETAESFLPAELLESVKPLASVSFAGGEPFLHEDIVDLIKVVHKNNPQAKVVFSSNGFRTDEIVKKAKEILAIHPLTQITISLDGVGRMHDQIRGIPGAWKKVNATFDALGAIGMKNRNFGFTITPHNFSEIPKVYAHAKEKGAGLSLAVAQSSAFLNVEIDPVKEADVYPVMRPIIEDHLRSWRPLNWFRAFFFWGIVRYLATGKRPLSCDALDRQFLISQKGEIFSCHPLLWKAGELKENSLPDILAGDEAKRLRPEAQACDACWEVCTARSAIRANLFRVALWALVNKLSAHLGPWNRRGGSMLFPKTLKEAVS